MNIFFQYCHYNIGLFSIALHKVIAFSTFRKQELLLLISLLIFFHRYFTLNVLLPIQLSLLPLRATSIALKYINYSDSLKSDNYRLANKERSLELSKKIKQRILRAITLHGAIEKSPILLLYIGKMINLIALYNHLTVWVHQYYFRQFYETNDGQAQHRSINFI